MSDPISSAPLGNDPTDSNESDYVAQLGRISGKLLSANLLRNGVDLYFKDTDASDALLHLDVTGDRIGINTDPSAPIYEVDVNSNILSKNVQATSNAYIDNFTLLANGTISTNSDINISPSGANPRSLFNAFGSQDIVFDDNQLYSLSNNDIVVTPDGIGTVELEASTNITGNLYVTGTINLDGDLTTIEDITVGNNNSEDLLTFLAKVTSDLEPNVDSAYDLGNQSDPLRWRNFYSDNLYVTDAINTGNINISSPATIESTSGDLFFNLSGTNKFITFTNGAGTPNFVIQNSRIKTSPNADLQFEASGTGKVLLNNNTDFLANLSIFGQIEMSGDLSTTSNIIIGDDPTDVLTINTDLSQDILPKITLTYDLGKSDFRWQNAYIDDWRYIANINTDSILVDNQMLIGGSNNLRALVGNNDLILNPASGINIIEELKFEDFLPIVTPSENLAYTIDNPNAYPSDADIFGYAVDASASYFIVGAHQEDDAGGVESGKAYVFSVATGSLLYTLDNPNPFGTSLADRFGYSVGITESYAIVGAYLEDGSGTSDEGKAYIYSTTTGGLLHTLNNPNPSSNDRFGWSVSISESYAIVGAYGEAGFAGKAYIYDTATGTLLHTLTNPNADPTAGNDTFGISVSITDTHAIVGANNEDDGALTTTGKAYIFSSVTGSLLYTLNNPTPSTNDSFGWSVSVSDSYAAVGAYLDTINGYTYIYDLSTGSLLHSLGSPFNSGAFGAQFGYSVSITDDYTVVGAPKNGVVAQDSGRAYIYDTATGVLLHTLENPNAFGTSGFDLFGYSVAISDTCIVVGAYFEDDALPGNNSGKAYVFGDITTNESSVITNLNTTTPVTLASTGIGYYKFDGTNGFVVPAGDNSTRPSSPEIGDTRWNIEEQYLECFDGSVYIISIGPGDTLSVSDVEQLNTIYSLILG
jgi:hypothetical protein